MEDESSWFERLNHNDRHTTILIVDTHTAPLAGVCEIYGRLAEDLTDCARFPARTWTGSALTCDDNGRTADEGARNGCG